MPFTFSHPAIVLPLKRIFGKWVSLTGLIIGSLTPDFEYFFRMKIQSEFSHTILGTLWFDFPLGIVLCFIFHEIVKTPLIENLPQGFQNRLLKLKDTDWKKYFRKNWAIVFISITIGAYSHVLWDSFTHQHAYFVNLFSLDNTINETNVPIYKILQHLSSLVGGIIIIWYFLIQKKLKNSYTKPKINFWLGIILITIIILTVKLSIDLNIQQYGNVIVSGISALMISIITMSLITIKTKKMHQE